MVDPSLQNDGVAVALYRLCLAIERGAPLEAAARELAFCLRADEFGHRESMSE